MEKSVETTQHLKSLIEAIDAILRVALVPDAKKATQSSKCMEILKADIRRVVRAGAISVDLLPAKADTGRSQEAKDQSAADLCKLLQTVDEKLLGRVIRLPTQKSPLLAEERGLEKEGLPASVEELDQCKKQALAAWKAIRAIGDFARIREKLPRHVHPNPDVGADHILKQLPRRRKKTDGDDNDDEEDGGPPVEVEHRLPKPKVKKNKPSSSHSDGEEKKPSKRKRDEAAPDTKKNKSNGRAANDSIVWSLDQLKAARKALTVLEDLFRLPRS